MGGYVCSNNYAAFIMTVDCASYETNNPQSLQNRITLMILSEKSYQIVINPIFLATISLYSLFILFVAPPTTILHHLLIRSHTNYNNPFDF